jgi:hypothetical protein
MNQTRNTRILIAKILPIAFVVVFCMAWFTQFQWNLLTKDLWYNDDSAQHVAWMWKWRSGHQFGANDLMNHAAEQFQQWGYWAVGRLAMLVMTPIAFSKYMPFFTLLAACLLAFFIVKKRFGIALAMAAAVLVGFLTFERMVGFNGRAFAYPLLLLFLYFFMDGKWRGVAIALVISALFYPTVLLIELAMLGLHGLRWAFLLRKNLLSAIAAQRKTIVILAACALMSVAIPIVKSRQIAADPNIGPMFSAKELLSLPMFESDGGRVDFPGEMRPLRNVLSNGLQEPTFMLPIVAVFALLLLAIAQQNKQQRHFDLALLYLPVAGIGMLLLARWQLPALFLPTRFLTYMYPVFFALLLVRLLTLETAFFEKKWAAALLIGALVLPTFWVQLDKSQSQYSYLGHAALFEKVTQLPPDHGLIAGPLFSCDMLSMHCQRSVLFSYEGFHALYFKNYWEKMAERYRDYLDATTSTDPEMLKSFIKKYQIAYLVLDVPFLERGKVPWNFKPFDKYIEERLAANPGRDFAALKLPADLLIEVDAHYRILDCRKWLRE